MKSTRFFSIFNQSYL